MRLKHLKVLFCCCLLISFSCYGYDNIRLDDKTALFTVIDKSVPIVSTKYVGWGENWAWAGTRIKSDAFGDKNKSISYQGENRKLGLEFSKTINREKDKLTWNYAWDKKMDYPNAMGVGIEFNLKLDSPGFGSPAQAPELLPDNKGWRWTTPDGQKLEVTFSPALAKLYFERGKTNKIRALFFTAIDKGSAQTTMTVTVAGKQSDNLDADKKGYDPVDIENWHKDILSDKASPVDLSFLNAAEMPAGKHGFVKAKSDQLVFEDGTPARFWGANIMAFALFSSSDNEIKAHANRIAKLGFNLIRLHHHDSNWVKPNIFANPSDNTQELSEQAFKKLDWWIKCLKEEGVYVWLDLHVGRTFTDQDGIDNFDELAQAKGRRNKIKENNHAAQVKGYSYYNESIQKQMQNFNKAYLTHLNTFTGFAYKDDPAVVALLITNENDLSQHFGNLLLPNKGVPEHNAIFTSDVQRFSEANGFKNKKAGRVWDMGEPKIYLADVEHRFNQDMISHLRGFGVKSMVATTSSWGKMGLFSLPSLTDGDLVDAHSYGTAEEFSFDPHYYPSFLAWIGAAQVTGKPLSVTEWNIEPFPADDRFTAPIFTASIANLQDWDAMMLYGYSQAKLGENLNGGNYSSYNDPAIIGMMPAAALLFRQNHVSVAKNTYELKLNREDFFYKKQDPTTSKAIRTLLETSRFSVTVPEIKELPWLKSGSETAKNISIVSTADKDFIPEKQGFVQSDTGELKRDWQKGIQTVNTSNSQIASGWIGGELIKLQDVVFKINTKKAVVSVQSLDGKGIKKSKNIFITVMARSVPVKDKKLPFLSEPVSGEITISAPEGLKLYPVNRMGERGEAMAVGYAKGEYSIKLDDNNDSYWFFLSVPE